MKRIVFTGGGSAGHVTPNLAIISSLDKKNWEIHYIGTSDGIEHTIIRPDMAIYHSIKAGKLRRYVDVKNITDPFKVIYGTFQAMNLISKLKPDIIFSKGGFVSVPVTIGGWLNKVPVIIHESDMTPGLANRIASVFATKVCSTFPEAVKYLPKDKAIYTGTPVRKEILNGDYEKGLKLCGFDRGKPVIMVMGGSLGSKNLNRLIRGILSDLLKDFQIVHICGKGNIDNRLEGLKGYKQFEYVTEEQPHLFRIASLIISRAGANSIFEYLYLKLPSILIPLPLKSSRGDQILNARSFEKSGFSKVLMEDDIDEKKLYNNILEVYNDRRVYINNMIKKHTPDGTQEILKLIEKYSKE